MIYRTLLLILLIATPLAIAQTSRSPSTPISPSKSSPNAAYTAVQPRRLKINLTVTNPQDLKIREGDKVSKGQILADRDSDRRRYNRERRETLLQIAKIEQTPLPSLKMAPPLTELPETNYSIERASVEQAELKFTQAQRNYSNALTNDPFITARANVDHAKANIEQAYREVENQQKKLEAIAQIKGIPPEMLTHETEKLKEIRSNWEKAQAEFNFKSAGYKQVQQARGDLLRQLQNSVEQARGDLELAQAKERAAKQDRNRLEYEHQITNARRNEEANQSAIALSGQKLEREFKLSQLQERIGAIDEKLSALARVRSPFSGTIKRIKIENQSDNTLKVTLSLIPG